MFFFTSTCGKIYSHRVRQWANRIGNEAYNFTENMNGAKDLEKVPKGIITLTSCIFFGEKAVSNAQFVQLQAYREVPFTIEDVKPSEVLTTMKREMEYFFSNKTNALKVWLLAVCGFP